ncbi:MULTISPECIES: response regulator transcription factor [Chryseobacterium]|jgi:Response regulator containing a CheY-like receiver domain and an HTH DNA-binding domain|uniref:DNA-binding NarL/FixJ family response regulator n=1 Tax=Chryseobacterium rhizosphaerae TaxID=395937 RepID=A0AAE3Y7D3_9FLAO|nr:MULTISPECIES: response regulator transcription factor [Chryseobacterium]MBL3547602.1 response regulator transcription factor [Chryseobacterium sp. KMC2]MDC8100369.1 response regulator transcription factor [Chryseobacterium rhizosphaerae]MDR6525247.1 DNA-binding NarL/FixJ family response regulator [Chryseobacterium rhizosphaerae]MDR6545617.1 DNA-binding NarL/FixJ family response regulator [Chryseobacterium rhizosphaerae]REC76310.1 DNA-binding response regulator [Chryseobacterium rhizosphaera
MIKVAITDDHPLLLEGLKNILGNSDTIDVVDCFKSVSEMNAGLAKQAVDILLLDINLVDTNSIELIQPLKKKYENLQIIMLSVHNELPVINSTLSEGALGYIQKNASVSEILEGISTVYSGDRFLCSQTRSVLEKKSSDGLHQVPKLTRREKEILAEAAKGLTTNQMAEKLFISPHTVESHRKNLIEKFQTSNLSSAIKLAIEYGLIIE